MKEIIDKIGSQPWRKNKWAGNPHEYIVDKWSPEFFQEMCEVIDKNFHKVKWRDGQIYHCINIGEYRYWHYDTILNRCLLSKAEGEIVDGIV